MSSSLSKPNGAAPLDTLQSPRKMLRADLNVVQMAQKEMLGRVLARVPQLLGLTDKEFAARIGVETNQLSAWHAGKENPALWKYYRDDGARRALLVALGERLKLAKVTTSIVIEAIEEEKAG